MICGIILDDVLKLRKLLLEIGCIHLVVFSSSTQHKVQCPPFSKSLLTTNLDCSKLIFGGAQSHKGVTKLPFVNLSPGVTNILVIWSLGDQNINILSPGVTKFGGD